MPELFTKYSQEELSDFPTFYMNHFPNADTTYARQRWLWARTDVFRRATRSGEPNPLEFTRGNAANIAADLARIEQMKHAERNLTVTTSTDVKPIPTKEEREAIYASLEGASLAKGIFSHTQEQTTFTVPQDAPTMIWFVGDIHSGGTIRYDLLKRDMETLRDLDGAYAIGMGDYTDNFKPQAKSGTGLYAAAFGDPRLQLAHVTDRMSIPEGKWIALCQGNHDAWDYKYAGIDRLPDLAQHLSAAYFSEAGGTVFVNVGGQRYVVVVKHQYAGGSRLNTTNNQRRVFDEFPQWENADVVCLAHLHYNDLHQTPRKGGTVTYLRTGTYKTEDEWSRSHGYTPEYGVPSVILFPDKHIVLPFRGDRIEEAVHYFKFLRATYGR